MEKGDNMIELKRENETPQKQQLLYYCKPIGENRIIEVRREFVQQEIEELQKMEEWAYYFGSSLKKCDSGNIIGICLRKYSTELYCDLEKVN